MSGNIRALTREALWLVKHFSLCSWLSCVPRQVGSITVLISDRDRCSEHNFRLVYGGDYEETCYSIDVFSVDRIDRCV